MNRLRLTPVATALAWLALFATLVPTASACCCRKSKTQLKSCCTAADAKKTCCQAKDASAWRGDGGQQRCRCGSKQHQNCDTHCRCGKVAYVQQASPVVPANDTHPVPDHLGLGWPTFPQIPWTLVDCAIEFAIRPDAVLNFEERSAQILLGVWRN